MAGSDLVPTVQLPPELEGWVILRTQEEALGRGWVVWLERVMPDGTTLRFEALIHDLEHELTMMVPIIQAITALSAPDVRLSVTRTRTTFHDLQRSAHMRRLTGGS